MENLTKKGPSPSETAILTAEKRIASHLSKRRMENIRLPRFCILSFFPSLYGLIKQKYKPGIVKLMLPNHPYYVLTYQDIKIATVFPGLGSPMAGMILDESIALGSDIFLFIGSAGLLNPAYRDGLILPGDAFIDEGTSSHYLPNIQTIETDIELTTCIETVFRQHRLPYRKGRVWTTDAPYRETPSAIEARKKDHCIAVDMEASALLSIARFYGRKISGFFYPSDLLGPDGWEPLQKTVLHPHRMFELALEVLVLYAKTTDLSSS